MHCSRVCRVNRVLRSFVLLCAASWSTAQPMVGPYRAWMPWTPKWGVRLFGTIMLGTAIAAGVLKPKKKRITERRDRMRELLYMVADYNDPWSEKEYAKEFERCQKSHSKHAAWYWAMTIIAIVSGLYTACELYNRFYWRSSRFGHAGMKRSYRVGSKELQKYLQYGRIVHREVVRRRRSGRRLMYVSESVNSLPRIKKGIETAADLSSAEVLPVLQLVDWSCSGFAQTMPEADLPVRVQRYLESLYRPQSSSVLTFAYVEDQLRRTMKMPFPVYEQGVHRDGDGVVTAVSL